MPHVRESKSPSKDPGDRISVGKSAPASGLAGLQRAIGNGATVGLLQGVDGEDGFDADLHLPNQDSGLNAPQLVSLLCDAGGAGAVQRRTRSGSEHGVRTAPLVSRVSTSASSNTVSRWPWTKTKTETEPQITPEQARDIQNAIAKSPQMREAEGIRATGTDDAEDKALAKIEDFWDNGEVEVNGKKVKLKAFKPLLFTPSERRVRQINKIRNASNVKAGFDKAISQGRIDPTKTETPLKQAPSQQPQPGTTGGTTTTPEPPPPSAPPGSGVVGTIGSTGGGLSKVSGYGTDIGSHFQDPTTGSGMSEGAKLLDTKYNNTNDPMYGGPPSFESKSDWAGSVIEIVQGAFGLVSSVADIMKAKGSKETAEASTGAASTVTSTANSITAMVQNIQGSDVTTNMFHWVPGLSVLSNALSAVKSALALAPKAIQLDSLRTNGSKVKSDSAREDVKLAVSRLAVRSAQQVEQESFAVAKSLTKAGLSLAEVVTAGGFGIPRLATVVMDGVGVLHSIGHAIADFVRANASGKARMDFFGAHKTGSAEKLLNTDPSFAADAILSRATEGDAQALAILAAFDIKVPAISSAKLVKVVTQQMGKGTEQVMEYDYDKIGEYDAAKAKLVDAIKPEKTVGETVDQVTSLLTERTDGLAVAKRLAEVRNKIKLKGKDDRGFGYKALGFFKGKSGLQKSVDKTEKAIRDSKTIPEAEKADLILKLKGIDPAVQKSPGEDKQIGKPVDNATLAEAMKMSTGKLAQIVNTGSAAVGGPGPKWEAYLFAYAQKLG